MTTVMQREEHYVGCREKGTEVQGRRKRGRPKRRWLDRVRGGIREKLFIWQLSVRKCTTQPYEGIYHQTSTPHESRNNMKRKKKRIYKYYKSCEYDPETMTPRPDLIREGGETVQESLPVVTEKGAVNLLETFGLARVNADVQLCDWL